MRSIVMKCTSGAIAAALLFGSTASFAASTPAAPQAQSSWMALSMLSPAGATALGSAAAAAQPVYPAPPPQAYDRLRPPPIPVILVVVATLLTMIYIATRNDHHPAPTPNSPV